MRYKLKAVRNQDFDNPSENRPFAVVHDVYDKQGNFIESGTDWAYFTNEIAAKEYCESFNTKCN